MINLFLWKNFSKSMCDLFHYTHFPWTFGHCLIYMREKRREVKNQKASSWCRFERISSQVFRLYRSNSSNYIYVLSVIIAVMPSCQCIIKLYIFPCRIKNNPEKGYIYIYIYSRVFWYVLNSYHRNTLICCYDMLSVIGNLSLLKVQDTELWVKSRL